MGRGDDLVAVLLKGGLVLQVGAARRQAARLGVDVKRAVYAVQHWLPLQRCAHKLHIASCAPKFVNNVNSCQQPCAASHDPLHSSLQ